jgi:hypothetical protein
VGFYSAGGNFHGFLEDLGTATFSHIDFPGALGTQPSKLNANDQIVGTYTDLSGIHGFFEDLATATFSTVDFPGAAITEANGINDQGDIVGRYISPDDSVHGFLATPVPVSVSEPPSLLFLPELYA